VQTENLLNGPKTWLAQGAMTTLCGRSTPPAGFRDSIELARFVAAFGVVIAHAVLSPKDWFGHTALSLFLILTAFLMAQSFLRTKVPFLLWLRAKRLLTP
jgi:peptidoglycan/LPS O-acetylase OafA/YrhL